MKYTFTESIENCSKLPQDIYSISEILEYCVSNDKDNELFYLNSSLSLLEDSILGILPQFENEIFQNLRSDEELFSNYLKSFSKNIIQNRIDGIKEFLENDLPKIEKKALFNSFLPDEASEIVKKEFYKSIFYLRKHKNNLETIQEIILEKFSEFSPKKIIPFTKIGFESTEPEISNPNIHLSLPLNSINDELPKIKVQEGKLIDLVELIYALDKSGIFLSPETGKKLNQQELIAIFENLTGEKIATQFGKLKNSRWEDRTYSEISTLLEKTFTIKLFRIVQDHITDYIKTKQK